LNFEAGLTCDHSESTPTGKLNGLATRRFALWRAKFARTGTVFLSTGKRRLETRRFARWRANLGATMRKVRFPRPVGFRGQNLIDGKLKRARKTRPAQPPACARISSSPNYAFRCWSAGAGVIWAGGNNKKTIGLQATDTAGRLALSPQGIGTCWRLSVMMMMTFICSCRNNK
jgi:hypothetical protein